MQQDALPIPAAAPSKRELVRFRRMIWLPFWFAMFLSLVTIAFPLLFDGSLESGLPAFIMFIPMVFWHVCLLQRTLGDRIARLEQAIGELAAKPAS